MNKFVYVFCFIGAVLGIVAFVVCLSQRQQCERDNANESMVVIPSSEHVKLIKNIHTFFKKKNINRIIVHGFKTKPSHTHHYIHDAIYKSFEYILSKFKELGLVGVNIKLLWINDTKKEGMIFAYKKDLNNLIFASPHYENDRFLPILENSYYLLHHPISGTSKYDTLFKNKKALRYIEYRSPGNDSVKFLNNSKLQYYDQENAAVTMPWATNISYHEVMQNINKIDKRLPFNIPNGCVFCGSVWMRNEKNMDKLKSVCKKLNIHYTKGSWKDEDVHQNKIRGAFFAPAIQGDGHRAGYNERGNLSKFYIPCRIFKNVSFGTIPITNNKGVYDLFNDAGQFIIYDDNIENLVKKAIEYQTKSLNDYDTYKSNVINNMKYVAENHTYVNRIETMLSIFSHF